MAAADVASINYIQSETSGVDPLRSAPLACTLTSQARTTGTTTGGEQHAYTDA